MAESLKEKISGINYVQLPVRLSSSVYDEARKWATDFFSGISGVAALYEYGTVGSLGISDLDLMAVLADKSASSALSGRLKMKNIPEKISYLLNDRTVKLIDKKNFKKIKWLGEFKNKLLWGEDIKVDDIPEVKTHLVNIASVMDFLPERILTLAEQMENKSIPATDMLGYLKSYLISAKSAQMLMKKSLNCVTRFSEKLRNVRDNWFHIKANQRVKYLSALIEEALASGIEAVREFASFLTNNGYYAPPLIKEESYFYFNEKQGFLFSSGEILFSKKQGRLLFSIPAVWLEHFCFYGRQKGVISSIVRKNIVFPKKEDKCGIAADLAEVLLRRINIANDMAGFLKKRRIPLARLYRFAHVKKLKKI